MTIDSRSSFEPGDLLMRARRVAAGSPRDEDGLYADRADDRDGQRDHRRAGAFFAIQDMVLRQTDRVFARVDATQSARIGDGDDREPDALGLRLRGRDADPGREHRNDAIQFISKYGAQARLTPEKHVITLQPHGGTLVDTTYPSTGGAGAQLHLLDHGLVAPRSLADNVSRSGSTPVFQLLRLRDRQGLGG